jgi:hypothetical protein
MTPLPEGHIQAIRHFRCHLAHGDSKFARLGSFVIFAALVLTQPRGKEFGAIGDDHAGVLCLSVTQEAQVHLRPRFARGDVGHQFGTLTDLLAVHRGNGIAHFQSCLIGGAAGHHT